MLIELQVNSNFTWKQNPDKLCNCHEKPKGLFVPYTIDEDSISDWSTDSCGWSDDDFGLDLDVTTPPLSVDSGAADTSDQEIVRCICEVEEENDFMIQVSLLFASCQCMCFV